MRASRLFAGALLTVSAFLPWTVTASAQAASPSITVSPAENVAPGSMVTVTGTGFAAGGGIYVQFCEQPSGTIGTAGGRASTCNPDQENDHTVWKTPIAASGEFSVQLRLEATAGSTDCSTAACGVFTRKDHMGGQGDFSQDAFAPVSFAAAAAQPSSTTTTPTSSVGAGQEAGSAPEVAGSEELAMTGASPWLAIAGVFALGLGASLVVTTRRQKHPVA